MRIFTGDKCVHDFVVVGRHDWIEELEKIYKEFRIDSCRSNLCNNRVVYIDQIGDMEIPLRFYPEESELTCFYQRLPVNYSPWINVCLNCGEVRDNLEEFKQLATDTIQSILERKNKADGIYKAHLSTKAVKKEEARDTPQTSLTNEGHDVHRNESSIFP